MEDFIEVPATVIPRCLHSCN